MILLEFKGGTDGSYRVFICPDMVVSVTTTTTEGVVNITLENAIVQSVLGDIDQIVATLTKPSA